MASKKQTSAKVQDRIRRMKWWHDAQFGMFIHWGVYALEGRHEWLMETEGIPVAEYERLARKFKPKPNAAREWAKLARRAGMKYMVMTSKHLDGYCLFNSQLTNWCAPKQACGRDLVAEFVDAARSDGTRFGFYYSLMDWHHPDGVKCGKDEAARRRYVDYIHGQLRELCTNYGKMDILWYDAACSLSLEGYEVRKMNRMVRKLQPDIVINNRSLLPEDFDTPEGAIEPGDLKDGRGWETCTTTNNDSWGHHINSDDEWIRPKQVIRDLISCARGGGNYLLNIGPKADGSVPPPAAQTLGAVGEWLDRNRETIFGTDLCDFRELSFAQFTRRSSTLYAHLFRWPGESFGISDVRPTLKSAKLLCTRQDVQFEQDRFRVRFSGLPKKAPDAPVTVLELEFTGRPQRNRGFFATNHMKRGGV